MSQNWSASVETLPYEKLDNPKASIYVYVGDNPLSNVEPDGHDCRGKDSTPCIRNTQLIQAVNFHNSRGDVVSSVNVPTNLAIVSDAKIGELESAYAKRKLLIRGKNHG